MHRATFGLAAALSSLAAGFLNGELGVVLLASFSSLLLLVGELGAGLLDGELDRAAFFDGELGARGDANCVMASCFAIS